jgi:hypothetical protein
MRETGKMKKNIHKTLKILGLSTALWVAQGVAPSEASLFDQIKGFDRSKLKKAEDRDTPPPPPPLPGEETKTDKKAGFLAELKGFDKSKLKKVDKEEVAKKKTENPLFAELRKKQQERAERIKKEGINVKELSEKAQKEIERPPVNVSDKAQELKDQIGKLKKVKTVERSGIELGKVVEEKPVEEVAEEETMFGNLFDEEEVVSETVPVEKVEETAKVTEEAVKSEDIAEYTSLDQDWEDVSDRIERETGDTLGRSAKRRAQKELADVEAIMDEVAEKLGAPSDK